MQSEGRAISGTGVSLFSWYPEFFETNMLSFSPGRSCLQRAATKQKCTMTEGSKKNRRVYYSLCHCDQPQIRDLSDEWCGSKPCIVEHMQQGPQHSSLVTQSTKQLKPLRIPRHHLELTYQPQARGLAWTGNRPQDWLCVTHREPGIEKLIGDPQTSRRDHLECRYHEKCPSWYQWESFCEAFRNMSEMTQQNSKGIPQRLVEDKVDRASEEDEAWLPRAEPPNWSVLPTPSKWTWISGMFLESWRKCFAGRWSRRTLGGVRLSAPPRTYVKSGICIIIECKVDVRFPLPSTTWPCSRGVCVLPAD